MIDIASQSGLERIAARRRDVEHADVAGFTPEASDVAGPTRIAGLRDPLAVVAPEGTYFLSDDGRGAIAFGRDGRFALADGVLRGPEGRPVLGFPNGGGALAPLRADPHDAALGELREPCIAADGTFTYGRSSIDPRTGERRVERVTAGRVALARFPAGTQLARVEAGGVRPPAGVAPRVGVPGSGDFSALVVGARDLGRVDIVTGLQRLDEAYLAYGAMRAAFRGRAEAEKATMELVK